MTKPATLFTEFCEQLSKLGVIDINEIYSETNLGGMFMTKLIFPEKPPSVSGLEF